MSRHELALRQLREAQADLERAIRLLSGLAHEMGQGELEVDDSTKSLVRQCRQLCIEAAQVAANVEGRLGGGPQRKAKPS
jgi:hypothetical protein